MTPEEIKKRLEDLGVDTGRWSEAAEQTGEIKLIQSQKKQLTVLRKLLQNMVGQNRDLSLQLQERVNRLKYGGGS